tara:strand:+ start:23072 stop:23347 length:276 start_codon:yes stop_codon:yes gene_type:complete
MALSAAAIGSASMSRMSLPMNCRWRRRALFDVMRWASAMASSRRVSSIGTFCNCLSLSAVSASPRFCSAVMRRFSSLLLGGSNSSCSSVGV